MNKLLIYGGIAIGAMALVGRKKYQEAAIIMENLSVRISSINNFNPWDYPDVTFSGTLTLVNNSNIDFGATLPTQIYIKDVRVFAQGGDYLGKAMNVNQSSIELLVNGTMDINNVQFQVDSQAVLDDILANLESYLSNDFSLLRYEVDIVAFGKTFTIEA